MKIPASISRGECCLAVDAGGVLLDAAECRGRQAGADVGGFHLVAVAAGICRIDQGGAVAGHGFIHEFLLLWLMEQNCPSLVSAIGRHSSGGWCPGGLDAPESSFLRRQTGNPAMRPTRTSIS